MKIEVIKVELLIGLPGSDTVILTFPILEGIWPFQNNTYAKIDIANGLGKEWCKTNFPDMNVEVIDCKIKG